MAVTKFKVFHGVGAVVAEVKNNTTFSLIAIVDEDDVVDFTSTTARFPIDLDLSPSNCGFASWDKVEVDDRGIMKSGVEISPGPVPYFNHLALTCIGSGSLKEPAHGAFIGAVYLEHEKHKTLKGDLITGGKFPSWPGKVYRAEQMTSITYITDSDVRTRYHGFMATVTDVAVDGTVTVSLDNEKDSTGKSLTFSFTPGDEKVYDPAPPADAIDTAQSLATNLTKNSSGALFLELSFALNLKDSAGVPVGARGPKLPVGFEK